MSRRRRPRKLASLAALALALGASPALGDDAVQDLAILGETRPVLLRLRVTVGPRPFRSAWEDSARALFARVDRDGDGKLDAAEAEAGALPPSFGGRAPDRMVEALRESSGPLRVVAVGLADRRTDALFDLLDRDRDGRLDKGELAGLVGSLRRLDFDDDEAITAEEVALGDNAPASAPAMVAANGRPARPASPSAPVVVELEPDETPLRVARLVLKKYDTASDRGPGRPDSRLTPEEFAIDPAGFAQADRGNDGRLDVEDVRRYLGAANRDATLDVALATEPSSGRPTARFHAVDGDGPPRGFVVRPRSDQGVEAELGPIRLDIRVVDDPNAAESARKALRGQVEAADANQDGYLELSELPAINGQPSPLTPLFKGLDRDGDGKVYPAEVDAYATLRHAATGSTLTLTASDEGRSLFGLLDLDRDRRLGAREVLNAAARLSACDRDGDGRVAPEEIPHHIQVTLARGEPAASTAGPSARSAAGPGWFRKMDGNGDGDVSRREFLGGRDQFDKLDRDHDGLIAPDEAEAARPSPGKG